MTLSLLRLVFPVLRRTDHAPPGANGKEAARAVASPTTAFRFRRSSVTLVGGVPERAGHRPKKKLEKIDKKAGPIAARSQH